MSSIEDAIKKVASPLTAQAAEGKKKVEEELIPDMPMPPDITSEAPAPMPSPDDETVEKARRQSIRRQKGRRGRKSTILTAMNYGGLGG